MILVDFDLANMNHPIHCPVSVCLCVCESVGKGRCAKMVLDMMVRMRQELGMENCEIVPSVNRLIVIDRFSLSLSLLRLSKD